MVAGIIGVAYYIWRSKKSVKELEKNNVENQTDTNKENDIAMGELEAEHFLSKDNYVIPAHGSSSKEQFGSLVKILAKFKDNTTKLQLDRTAFTLGEIIGRGNFGDVHKGEIINGQTNTKTVAIKCITGFGTEKEIADFLAEITIMSQLNDHLNLVSMIGSCTTELEKEDCLWLIIEYCEHGDLKTYLRNYKQKLMSGTDNEIINSRCLILWSFDIAKGMQYLAKNQIMHGDLAARNVLIATDPLNSGYPLAKVADFGLSKQFYDNIKYTKETRVEVPWKWMALEFLKEEFFTLTSDVWSFAVTVWEIFSLGRSPYGPQGFNEILEQLENGYRLPCPKETKVIASWSTEKFYKMISDACFTADPIDRASFSDVVSLIGKELSHEELSLYEKRNRMYHEMFLKT